MSGWDYGKTPNVWRPSEVQVPGTGADLGLGAQPVLGDVFTTTITEYGYPPLGGRGDGAWITVFSRVLNHTVSVPAATTSTVVGDTQPPGNDLRWRGDSPWMRIILRGTIEPPTGGNPIMTMQLGRIDDTANYFDDGGLTAPFGSPGVDTPFIYMWVGTIGIHGASRFYKHFWCFKEGSNNQGQSAGSAQFGIDNSSFFAIATDALFALTTLNAAVTRRLRFLSRNQAGAGNMAVKPTLVEIQVPN